MHTIDGGKVVALLGLGLFGLSACVTARETPPGFASAARTGGYGICATRNAVSEVDIEAASPKKIEDLLELIPGVEVTNMSDGFSVQIRGTNGFAGSGQPLYVIDGMPYSGVRGQSIPVPPQDIECIEVLKDVGYTSIFGSRGANGVVLITTRRAR